MPNQEPELRFLTAEELIVVLHIRLGEKHARDDAYAIARSLGRTEQQARKIALAVAEAFGEKLLEQLSRCE